MPKVWHQLNLKLIELIKVTKLSITFRLILIEKAKLKFIVSVRALIFESDLRAFDAWYQENLKYDQTSVWSFGSKGAINHHLNFEWKVKTHRNYNLEGYLTIAKG
jgi:hypothetical protein